MTISDVSVGDALPSLSYDVTATTVVVGALATRDWRPQHHDYHFATERNGVKDIFLNSPNQLAWFERYLTDWSGPAGRLGRLSFRMIDSIFPGDTMVFTATVTDSRDRRRRLRLGRPSTSRSRSAVRPAPPAPDALPSPTTPDDNPWARRGERWNP